MNSSTVLWSNVIFSIVSEDRTSAKILICHLRWLVRYVDPWRRQEILDEDRLSALSRKRVLQQAPAWETHHLFEDDLFDICLPPDLRFALDSCSSSFCSCLSPVVSIKRLDELTMMNIQDKKFIAIFRYLSKQISVDLVGSRQSRWFRDISTDRFEMEETDRWGRGQLSSPALFMN